MAVPADRQRIVTKLHELNIALYPHAKVDMSYKMPTYKLKRCWVALANQKRYASLYTCGAQHITAFKQQYPEIKPGEECINFKSSDPVSMAGLSKVMRHAIENKK